MNVEEMGQKWKILDTGAAGAAENMALDQTLLEGLGEEKRPILHFYDWKRESATYGYFTDPEKYLRPEEVKKRGLDLAKRSTGGGIVFHIWDLAFSVLVPAQCELFSKNTLENYRFVNQTVLKAAQEFLRLHKGLSLRPQDSVALDGACRSFCMARPTKYDLMLKGKKVAGAAQRQTKLGFLHQGTIALILPDFNYLDDLLKEGKHVIAGMRQSTYPLLGEKATIKELPEGREELKQLLKTEFIQSGS